MGNLSYTVKALRFTFTLTGSNAVFPSAPSQSAANVLQVTGLRAMVHVQAAGAAMSTQVSARIYGLSQADMNALAVVNILNGTSEFINNTILIEASNDGGQSWQAVFAGVIVQAGPDYTEAPDVFLSVQAQTGFYEAIAPALPTSFPDSTDVGQICSVIAAKMGVPFVNNGVSQKLPGAQYFSGSLLNQLQRVCLAAHVAFTQDGPQSTVTITPWGSPRMISPVTLTPQSGLVGYPKVRGDGFIEVRALYDPAFLLLGILTISGSDVIVGSNVPTTYNSRANGSWQIGTMSHVLESQKPGGAWFTDMVLYPPTIPGAGA